MKKKLHVFVKVFLILFLTHTVSWGAAIYGYIRDASSGEPLSFANIYIEENKSGTISTLDGYYILSKVNSGKYEVTYSYIGFASQKHSFDIREGEDYRYDVTLEVEALYTDEILVNAERQKFKEEIATSIISLDQRSIEITPSFIEADVFRTLQLLPGIQSLNDFSPALYVRGSTPDQNLIMLDGITVYNPMHLGGIFSTFNTDAIKQADFQAGGFSAEYGGRMGSILNIVNREGNTEEIQGNVNISLLSSKALLEGPLPLKRFDNLKGSWMLAGRRTYFDVIVNSTFKYLIKPNVDGLDEAPDNIFPYHFYDYQFKTNLDISSNHRLTWSTFNGDDIIDFYSEYENEYEYESYYKSKDKFDWDWQWGNKTNSLQWRWIIKPNVILNTKFATSRFRFNVNISVDESSIEYSGSDTTTISTISAMDLFDTVNDETLESSLTWKISDNYKIKTGFLHKEIGFNLGLIMNIFDDYNGNVSTVRDTIMWMKSRHAENSFYMDNQWQITPLLSTQIGLRATNYSLQAGVNIEPRLGIKYFLTENTSLKYSSGRYYQYISTANPPDENLRFIDIWYGIPKEYDAPYSDHFILGLEHLSPTNMLFRVETYYKTFQNLLLLKPDEILFDEPDKIYIDLFNEFLPTESYAYGTELLLKKVTGSVQGWVGYTYSVTKRKYENQDWYPPKYDRTHAVNAVLNFVLNNKFTLSGAMTYSTGNPYTPVTGRQVEYTEDWWRPNRWYSYNEFLYGEKHSVRYPGYFRLDLSLKKRRPFKNGHLEWYFQILNVTNHMNVFMYIAEDQYDENWSVDDQGNYRSERIHKGVYQLAIPMFPFMPSLGVKYEF